jgi:hypothetical protein
MNNSAAEVAFPDGTAMPFAYDNRVNSGSLTWPILKVNQALLDQSTSVTDMGIVQVGARQAQQIRTQQNIDPDAMGIFSPLTQRDYFFDPTSFVLLRAQDSFHPSNDAVHGALVHTIDLGAYQSVNGMAIPFAITESIAGNQIWQIQLSSISFNTGLADSDFQFPVSTTENRR